MVESRTRELTLVALFSALSISIVVSGVSKYLSFPILTYLKFDPAEIPAFMALFLSGLRAAFGVAFFHFIFLLWFGEFTPIGPTMKFLAVASTLAGWGLGGRLANHVWVKLAVSSTLRVAVMTVANIYVLLFIFPEWIHYLGGMLGIGDDVWSVLSVVLALTAVYNVVHVVIVNYFAAKVIVDRIRAVVKG